MKKTSLIAFLTLTCMAAFAADASPVAAKPCPKRCERPCDCAVKPYISASGGFIAPQKTSIGGGYGDQKYKVGGTGSLAFGLKYDTWRFELEGTYKSAKIDKKVSQSTGGTDGAEVTFVGSMLNVYYDYSIHKKLDLYLGLGAGVLSGNLKANYENTIGAYIINKTSQTVFAMQAMLGLSYYCTPQFILFTHYKIFKSTHLNAGRLITSDTHAKSPLIHSGEIGMRYQF